MLKLFCLAVPKVGKVSLMCFRTVLISKILWILGVPWFSVEIFLSHSTKNVQRGNFCVSGAFLSFLDKRSVTVLLIFFCLTVQKYCVGQHFSVSLIFRYWQKLSIKGVYHDFLTKFFYLTAPKIFVGEPFCVSETSWYQNILDIRSITIFVSFFVLTVHKSFVGEPWSVSLFPGIENF